MQRYIAGLKRRAGPVGELALAGAGAIMAGLAALRTGHALLEGGDGGRAATRLRPLLNNEMAIGRTEDRESPNRPMAFEAAGLFGTGSRTPSGPAVFAPR